MKLLLNRVPMLMRFQFMTQVFGVAFAVFMMLAGLGYEQRIQVFMKTRIGKVVELVSTCSLEIYLVQFAIIGYLKEIVFPVNLIVIVAIILVAAYMVHKVSQVIYVAMINAKKWK